ncbi:MAG TPA: diguanylate cyclase [Gemmatimonadaceae bacterium]
MRSEHDHSSPIASDAGRTTNLALAGRRRPQNSLRGKLTLAFLLTGLASAAVVGLVARTVVIGRFNRALMATSFTAFQHDVAAYVTEYGSWDDAVRHESFADFARARQTPHPMVSKGEGAPPQAIGLPPFRFLLLDPNDRHVLIGPAGYTNGQSLPSDARAEARAIHVNGKIVAIAVPLREPNFAAYDATYLSAMQNAMLYGVGTATLLALALGFFFGERLSRSVRALTTAIGAMGKGQLRQRVEVRSRDEVGLMAEVFNRMSVELAESHTQIRAQAALLKELSIRDDLTGLHNRRHFDEQAANAYARALRYEQPLSVMICDVDRFKQVNDRFSHAAGDAVLAQLGRLLRATLRESDIVARYGGEEFVVAFPETGMAQAAALCERIRERVEHCVWDSANPDLRVTLSMGIDGDIGRGSIHAMLAAADARMYEAKAAGRNRVNADVASIEDARTA